jgi:hypothetical protein
MVYLLRLKIRDAGGGVGALRGRAQQARHHRAMLVVKALPLGCAGSGEFWLGLDRLPFRIFLLWLSGLP